MYLNATNARLHTLVAERLNKLEKYAAYFFHLYFYEMFTIHYYSLNCRRGFSRNKDQVMF